MQCTKSDVSMLCGYNIGPPIEGRLIEFFNKLRGELLLTCRGEECISAGNIFQAGKSIQFAYFNWTYICYKGGLQILLCGF